MKRALVTGATGFIGRALCARLRANGWQVIRAVRSSPGQGDIAVAHWTATGLAEVIRQASPGTIFHLAGTTRARDAEEMYRVNVGLTASLFDAVAACADRPAVVLAGSAAEYGYLPPEHLPARETGPTQPVTDYGISKYAQTLMGLSRARAGLAVLIARIFNPVGAGMPAHLALASFARQINSGVPELSVGNLDVTRDFVTVDDVASAIAQLAADPRAFGQVYNICSGEEYLLRPLVEDMIRLSGRDIRLTITSDRLRPGEMPRFVGDTRRLREFGVTIPPPDFSQVLPAILAG